MKTFYCLSVFTILSLCSTASWGEASLVKIGAGAQYNSSKVSQENDKTENKSEYEDNSYGSAFAQIQFGLPYIPNYKFSTYSHEPKQKNTSVTYTVKHQSHELFFAFSFLVFEAHIGAAAHAFTLGQSDDADHNSNGVTARIFIDVPAVPLTPSISIDRGVTEDKVDSVGINIAYSIVPGFYLDIGAKNYTYTILDDSGGEEITHSTKNDTVYLGLSFNIGL